MTGYKGEFSVHQGIGGSPISGLDPKLPSKLYDENGEVAWNKLTKEILLSHDARSYEIKSNTSDYLLQVNQDLSVGTESTLLHSSSDSSAVVPSALNVNIASHLSPLQTRAARTEALENKKKLLEEQQKANKHELESLAPLATSSPKKQVEHKVKQQSFNIQKLLEEARREQTELVASEVRIAKAKAEGAAAAASAHVSTTQQFSQKKPCYATSTSCSD